MRSATSSKSKKLASLLRAGQAERSRPWAWAAGFSLAAHGLLLSPWQAKQPPIQTKAVAFTVSQQSSTVSTAPDSAKPQVPAGPVQAAAPAPAPKETVKLTEPTVVMYTPEHAPSASAAPSLAESADQNQAARPPAAIAPAIDWRYLLLQNGRQGQARLTWRPDGAVYTLRMERELEGRPLPGSRSEGQLSQHGLSPERFTQQRPARAAPAGEMSATGAAGAATTAGRRDQIARDAAATNFRQGARQDQISFSSSAEQVPMPEGVQDRISWWLQLAAIVAARPQQFLPGQELRMMVVGLRGEAREWVFEVLAPGELDLPAGHIKEAVHLRRLALGPYSGEIEIWLDPARHHLPVRLLLNTPDERGWELRLLDEGLPQP